MAQVLSFGFCLLACLIFRPTAAEGTENGTLDSLPFLASRSRCSAGVLYYKGYCYEFANSYTSWGSAEVKCQELRPGAQLASVMTPNEGDLLYSYLRGFVEDDVWIGLQATFYRSGRLIWEWSDGSPFSSPLWDGDSPNSSSSRYRCISMANFQTPGYPNWLQRSCADHLPYLCKYKASHKV